MIAFCRGSIMIVVFSSVLVGLGCVLSCRNSTSNDEEKESMSITRATELALRGLLAEQEPRIRQEVPFVYDADTFSGDIKRSGPDSFIIGKWVVDMNDNKGVAILKKYYVAGHSMGTDVFEVRLDVRSDGRVYVTDWNVRHETRRVPE